MSKCIVDCDVNIDSYAFIYLSMLVVTHISGHHRQSVHHIVSSVSSVAPLTNMSPFNVSIKIASFPSLCPVSLFSFLHFHTVLISPPHKGIKSFKTWFHTNSVYNKIPQDSGPQQWPSKRCSESEPSPSVQDMLLPSTGSSETLESVIGLEEPKQILHEALVMPIKYPHLFQGKVD